MDKYYSQYQDRNILYEHKSMTNLPAEFTLHTHPICEILFVKSGKITYMIEGKNYEVGKNMLVFTRPSKGHSIVFEDGSEYERYLILFDDKALFDGLYKKIPKNFDVLEFGNNSIVIQLFEKFDYYCKHLEGADLKKVLYGLTRELLYNIIISSNEAESPGFHIVNRLVKDAVKYIDENIASNISIQEICDSLFITKSHLHHLFIKYLKMSPKKYIVSKKLVLARRKLRSGAKPVQIYANLGFSDYSSFYRAYKSYFGYSPSEETEIRQILEIKT